MLYLFLIVMLSIIVPKVIRSIQKRKAIKNGKYTYSFPAELSVYFGVPGSGKTTFAAYLAKQHMKKGGQVYSNVEIIGTYKLDSRKDLGKYMIKDARIIIDEAGIDYNNRDFKSFPVESLRYFKTHRHYRVAIDVFSQGPDDMDKKIRTLARRLYIVRKSLIKGFIYRRRIAKKVGISEMTKDIIDEYSFVPFSRKYIYAPKLWKMFDSYNTENLLEKTWKNGAKIN